MIDENLKMIPAYLETLGNVVTEVRILRSDRYLENSRTYTGETVSGYYDVEHYDKIVDDILMYDKDRGTKGIYITLHDCHPDLLHRAANRLRDNAKDTTSDTEIKILFCFSDRLRSAQDIRDILQ